MKAKDLAALAALGVAGFAAYDKFGKKGEEPKTRGKLGESQSANDGNAGEYRSDMLGKGRSANDGDAGESEARMSKRSRQENDVPDRIMGRDAAGSRFTDKAVPEVVEKSVVKNSDADARAGFAKVRAAGANSKTPKAALAASTANDDADAAAKSLSSKGGPSRASTSAAAESVAEAAPASTTRKFTPPGTQSSMGALSGASRPAAGNQAMAAMDRATVPAQGNVGSGNAAMGAFSQVKAVPKNIKYATEAEKARQTLIDEKNYDSDLMKNRRQAVVDTVKNIPANVKNAFKPLTKQEIIDQKNYDSQLNRDRREAAFGSVKNLFGFKKGGAVKKMASGGMTSSKMSSKASTASSRGDGIAQRGKTRGQMR